MKRHWLSLKTRKKDAAQNQLKQSKNALRAAVDKMTDAANPVTEKPHKGERVTKPLSVGDSVAMAGTGTLGTVVGAEKNGVYIVQFGSVKTKAKAADLVQPTKSQKRAEKAAEKADRGYKFARAERNYADDETRLGGMETDVRGINADEAVFHIDKFIDESIINGYETVTIIHGKGSGILRDAAMRYLRGNKNVKNARPGEYGEGDAGVTVVTLL